MLNGLDISCDQNDIDFHALKACAQVDWVHAKATEGVTYSDARFNEYHDQAKAVGMPFGAYHFFHGGDSGTDQAEHFLNAISGREGAVLPMVDCESGGQDGVDALTYLNALRSFLAIVDSSLGGKRSLIYFGYSFWSTFLGGTDEFSGHPAWPAAYSSATSLNMIGTGWTGWTVWQHTDGEIPIVIPQIPGIVGNVDRDRLNSDSLAIILR